MDSTAIKIAAQTGSVVGINREPFELFLIYEVRLLDERRFHEWMGLFTEDGYYWVPSTPDQTSPFDQVSLFFDDRDLMQTRFDRLAHPRIHVQTPPSRTVHLVSNVIVEAADEEARTYQISSNFTMVEYRQERQRLFAGRYRHWLVGHDACFKIACKKVELINCDAAFEAMAIPI